MISFDKYKIISNYIIVTAIGRVELEVMGHMLGEFVYKYCTTVRVEAVFAMLKSDRG